MTDLNRVQQLVEGIYDAKPMAEIMVDRQQRLKDLSYKYGVEATAIAAGLTISTLTQYLRVKFPSTIGEQSVLQAETVFKKYEQQQ